jgi:hypothetical protein
MHATTLTPRAESHLRRSIAKASQKFNIGTGWLTSSPMSTAILCKATNDLIRRSLEQNEVVFSAEGLTLLSLDRVYTFKVALMRYTASMEKASLYEAMDELRRLVLAQSGRRISKGYLLRAYDHLGVSLSALVDVNEAYKVCYGGHEGKSGIAIADEGRASPPPLKTTFGPTEKPSEKNPGSGLDRGPHRLGPSTPNGFEDITPVTRGEWCFLMVGDGWKEAKMAAVETC